MSPPPTRERERALLYLRTLQYHISSCAERLRQFGYHDDAEWLEKNLESWQWDYDPYEWKPVWAMIKDLEEEGNGR